VIEAVGDKFHRDFTFSEGLIGGAAIDATGTPLPAETVELAKKSEAVLLGSVGGPKWDNCLVRPEAGLLGIRKALGLYANIRPAKLFSALKSASVLKSDIVEKGLDLVTVRELTGGIYFGERGFTTTNFGRAAFDTELYSELEIERTARIAFELAEGRRRRLCLVDKANVLLSSKLWREAVASIAEDYPSVSVSYMYVDNAAMQLCLNPSQFDVILTSNLFGDILSDLSAAVVGSIGVMPSASLGETTLGMYEAIHGSAPDLAGKNVCNPVGTILSAAMLLRHSLDLPAEASAIEKAVEETLDAGLGTADIGGRLSTSEVTEEVVRRIAP
jgi:3-isopropylmalate dehydrogenase